MIGIIWYHPLTKFVLCNSKFTANSSSWVVVCECCHENIGACTFSSSSGVSAIAARWPWRYMKVCRLLLFLHRVVVSRPMNLPVSSEITLAIKLPVEESTHVSLSLFADALQPLSNSQVQRIKCTACQRNLGRSLKVQSAQRRTTKERIDNSAAGNPSSNMFRYPTNSTIPCLQKCPASHHLTHCMACSTQCLLIQRFSDLCGSLAVWKMENHGDLLTFSAFRGF